MTDLPKSRGWGSLLSGAVAGLESKLDVILAEDPNASARSRQLDREKQNKEREAKFKAEQGKERDGSKVRGNDRLQARLAMAMAKGERAGSASGRSSIDVGRERTESPVAVGKGDGDEDTQTRKECKEMEDVTGKDASVEIVRLSMTEPTPIPEPDSARVSNIRPDAQAAVLTNTIESNGNSEPASDTLIEGKELESLDYLEKIDALHSKVAYLSSQLYTKATDTATAEDTSTSEKKMAEQQATIAQLTQEGEKLSHDQLKYSRAIKGLRSRIMEQEKSTAELRKKMEQQESLVKDFQEELKSTQAREKVANERVATLTKVEKNLASVASERDTALNRVQAVMQELREADQSAGNAMKNAESDRLNEQIRLVSELNDELSNARIEKKLVEDRAKSEIRNIKEAHQRALDKTRLSESELRTEVQNLEAKLEVLRLKSEEISSSSTSDAQVKLLRQIETLQTQYSHASENWQSLEISLNSRVSAVEKERDDLAKREADVRRKSRETSSKARRLEEDLEASSERVSALESQVAALQDVTTKLEAKLKSAENDAQFGKDAIERSRREFEILLETRIEEEKKKMQAELATQAFSPVTPTESQPKYLRTDSYPSITQKERKVSTPDIAASRRSRFPSTDFSALNPSQTLDNTLRPGSRRFLTSRTTNEPSLTSKHGLPSPGFQTNGRHPGTPPILFTSNTPSIHTMDHSDHDEDLPERDTPPRTIAELISVSTAGAGPSVQLVERMSASVRRLEMEKAAARESIARLQAQRDQAREEIVVMMREVDEVRDQQGKVATLEAEMAQMKGKFDAVLEMLGEKTERCEDLENDVRQWKDLYQQHVDSSTK